MKRLLLGSTILLGMVASAAAADLPVYTKAPPPPPMWSWTGFYFGVQGGAGWGTSDNNFGLNGVHGGGTVGLNWQTGRVVFGVESDISAADIEGSRTRVKDFATLTGRLGVTVDQALVYIKGGAAWARLGHDVPVSDNRTGYTVGTGIEFGLWNHWSAKVEYDYMDFGTKTLLIGLNDQERVHVIKAGLNYRFDWGGWGGGPLFTKY